MSQCTRVTDRQTDGRTDGQTDRRTEFSSLDRVCIACSAVLKCWYIIWNIFTKTWCKTLKRFWPHLLSVRKLPRETEVFYEYINAEKLQSEHIYLGLFTIMAAKDKHCKHYFHMLGARAETHRQQVSISKSRARDGLETLFWNISVSSRPRENLWRYRSRLSVSLGLVSTKNRRSQSRASTPRFYRVALNAGRSSQEKAFCPSVCPCVCLSNACIVKKQKTVLFRFLYHTKDHLA